MTTPRLPDGLVPRLNALGFALTDIGRIYTFARAAIGYELHLTVEALTSDTWRVGLTSRAQTLWGGLPNPFVPISLRQYGHSEDGLTIEVSTADLFAQVPRLMGKCILPSVDLAPSWQMAEARSSIEPPIGAAGIRLEWNLAAQLRVLPTRIGRGASHGVRALTDRCTSSANPGRFERRRSTWDQC